MGCADVQERFHPGWRAASLLVPAVVFVFLVCMPGNGGARAQTERQKPLIVASKFIHLAPGAEVPVDITVWPPEAVQPGSTLMIRGLPGRVVLGQGKLVTPGVWGIPADITVPVKMTAPAGTEGVSELTIMLVTANGGLVTDFRATLVIEAPGGRAGLSVNAPPKKVDIAPIATIPERPAAVEPKANPMAIPVPPPPASSVPSAAPAVLTAEGKAKALKLMEKGDKSLASGNVTVARLCYQNAVELGWAPAAMALGGTYDPAELQQLNVVGGLQPDPQLAIKWYTRAQQLGAGDAGTRLQRLGSK
jgi:hypothetical protein